MNVTRTARTATLSTHCFSYASNAHPFISVPPHFLCPKPSATDTQRCFQILNPDAPTMPQPNTMINGVPTECVFKAGQLPTGLATRIPIYTFENLEQSKTTSLKNKALDLQQKIGGNALPPVPALRDELLAWIVDVQIKTIKASGIGGVTPRHLGVPDDWGAVDDSAGFFGGDGVLPSSAGNYLNANELPMEKLQPRHRGLSFTDNMHVNQIEATNGFVHSRMRNNSSHFYQNGTFQM